MTDPHWPRAGEWIAGDHQDTARLSLALLGAPVHKASISPSRADLAPAAIRAALNRFSVMDVRKDRDLRALRVADAGDLPVADLSPEDAFEPLSTKVRSLAAADTVVAILGGDNSVTRPGVHGTAALDRCGLITLDAHFDLRELDGGLTNGNPVRALLDDGVPGPHISQIGIQSFANSPDHARLATQEGIHVVDRDTVARQGIESCVEAELRRLGSEVDAIYVDFDVDVLDRSFSPATPGSRPGGITPLELQNAAYICGASPKVTVIDIVEVSPPDDIADVTVMAAAQIFLAFASGVVSRGQATST
ncbi:MAG TPA: agmatinase family protein [Actinomycetota bacterium]|nr:agmatinase family protein [Actinomycetota bacterium]